MKNERILVADDTKIVLEAISEGIGYFGKEDGHTVVGKAISIAEVRALMEADLKPTVALVDNSFPIMGDGQKAAAIIKQFSPDTKIISFSADPGLRWGEENWYKGMSPQQLIDALTKLQH